MFAIWFIILFGVDVLLGLEYLGCYKSSANNPELNVESSKDFGSIKIVIKKIIKSLQWVLLWIMNS